ncbi:MAG: hypothetical protein MZU97_19760 [Bacillus subtilis]|nr:hypothetical protein [Bacillus subtilis]
MDSTHIKAYANKRNVHNEIMDVEYNKYVTVLHDEINQERIAEGKAPADFKATKKVAVSERRSGRRDVSQGRKGETTGLFSANGGGRTRLGHRMRNDIGEYE